MSARRRDRLAGFGISLLLHILVFTAGGWVFSTRAEYGIDIGSGGGEVELVAAPAGGGLEEADMPEPVPVETPPEPVQETLVPEPEPVPKSKTQPETVPEPEPETKPPEPLPVGEVPSAQPVGPVQPPVSAPVPGGPSEYPGPGSGIGDGSSPEAGEDEMTLRQAEGGVADVKPHYLRNPPPPYPLDAVRNGWEGRVVLRVSVSKAGCAKKVLLEEGSGHDVLDEAALRAVWRWRFRPAETLGFPVESTVLVPIRFRLEDAKLR